MAADALLVTQIESASFGQSSGLFRREHQADPRVGRLLDRRRRRRRIGQESLSDRPQVTLANRERNPAGDTPVQGQGCVARFRLGLRQGRFRPSLYLQFEQRSRTKQPVDLTKVILDHIHTWNVLENDHRKRKVEGQIRKNRKIHTVVLVDKRIILARDGLARALHHFAANIDGVHFAEESRQRACDAARATADLEDAHLRRIAALADVFDIVADLLIDLGFAGSVKLLVGPIGSLSRDEIAGVLSRSLIPFLAHPAQGCVDWFVGHPSPDRNRINVERRFAVLFNMRIYTFALLPLLYAHGQNPPAPPVPFEVASIKANHSGRNGTGNHFTEQQATWTNTSLKAMITNVYRLKNYQLIGAPAWAETERWDIDAKTEAKTTIGHKFAALGFLLEDRFHLKVHRETRELPIYRLVVAKGGVKMIEVKEGETRPHRPSISPQPSHLQGWGCPVAQLADFLSGTYLNEPIVDATGLTGKYDFDLKWTADPTQAYLRDEAADPAGPSLFAALQEQLGLKLETAKGPVEVVVIDHVERPAEN